MSKANQKKFREQQQALINTAIARREANKKAKTNLESTLIIVCWVLHDKYGFGKIRLDRLIKEVKELIKDYNEDRFEAKDLVNQLYEETGIDDIKF